MDKMHHVTMQLSLYSPVFRAGQQDSKNPEQKLRRCGSFVDAGCWTSILMSCNSPAICKIPSSRVPAAVSS